MAWLIHMLLMGSLASDLSRDLSFDLSSDLAQGSGGGSPPSVTSLGTTTGTEVGGNSITILGSGFTGATVITFGGVNATSYVVNNDGQITATVPALVAGAGVTFVGRATKPLSSTAADNTVDVVVTTPLGSSTLAGGYTYTSELVRLGATSEGRASNTRNTLVGGVTISSAACYAGNTALTQATGVKQPAYNATGFRGGPVIQPDGVDDLLLGILNAIAAGKRPSALVVFQRDAGGAGKYYIELSDQPTYSWYLSVKNGAAFYAAERGDSSGGSSGITSAAALDVGVTHLGEAHMDATGARSLAIDNVATSSPRTGTTQNSNPTKLAVGASPLAGFADAQIVHWAVAQDGFSSLTAALAFLNGPNFPTYTSNSYV